MGTGTTATTGTATTAIGTMTGETTWTTDRMTIGTTVTIGVKIAQVATCNNAMIVTTIEDSENLWSCQ